MQFSKTLRCGIMFNDGSIESYRVTQECDFGVGTGKIKIKTDAGLISFDRSKVKFIDFCFILAGIANRLEVIANL